MADVLYVGGKTFLVTRPESTYGTDPTTGDEKMGLVTNFTPNMKNNMIQVYALGGGRSYQQVVPGKFEASGTTEFDVQSGALFKYAIGGTSSATTTTTNFDAGAITGSGASLKRYAITEADVLTSFTMQITNQSDVSAADIRTIYTGVKINRLSVKFDTEVPMHASLDWIAQKPLTAVADYSAAAPTSFKDVPMMFYRGQLLMGAGDYGTAGVGTLNTMTDSTKAWVVDAYNTDFVLIDSLGMAFDITDTTATTLVVSDTPASGKYVIVPLSTVAANQVVQCNSIEMVLEQNLESYWTISNDTGRGTKYLVEKQREYSMTLDLNFTSVDQLGRFYNGAITGLSPTTTANYTKFLLSIDCKTALADGDNYKALKLVFTDVVFDETSLPVSPKDINRQTVAAKARNCMAFYITSDAL